jgi:hypothetical protein
MKKLLPLILLVSLFALFGAISETSVFASDIAGDAKESKQGTISSTDVASEVKINANHVLLVNDGTDEVYVKLNSTTVATTADFKIGSGESLVLDAIQGQRLYSVQYVCTATETATVRYLAWN